MPTSQTPHTGSFSAHHWLQAAADIAPDAAAASEIPSDASLEVAWEAVADFMGITQEELARRVAAHFRLGVADLTAREPQALKLLPSDTARRYSVLPLRAAENRLVVATGNPVDLEAEEALEFVCGRRVTVEVAPPVRVREALQASMAPDHVVDTLLENLAAQSGMDVRVLEPAGEEEELTEDTLGQGPVVKLVNLIVAEAVQAGASDIHIEPEQDGGRVRFRVDGVLSLFMRLPLAALIRVVSRLKILADLDIADRMRPQDGRIRIHAGGAAYDLRISTLPTATAEKCVLRISKSQESFSLDKLSLLPADVEGIEALLGHRNGIVIITGPTGSGKTTTLYAALEGLATGELNISTVENPIEYVLPGITQVQVDEKQGRTFAGVLRALLRQDPDVILVGETRDLETAETATRASMTGHLVLTTLHTNHAVGAVPRLVDIGLERASIASTLRGVIAQRLVRRLCPECAVPVGSPDELAERERVLADAFDVMPGRRAVGCPQCHEGFRGRLPIMEILFVTAEIAELIGRGALAAEIEKAARAHGMRRLRESALERVERGDTTLEEVERVLGAVPHPTESTERTGGRVLLIDDTPETRLLMRTVLEHHGFEVVEEAGAEAGLAHIEAREDISAVLLDLEMPGHDPIAALRRLRASPRTVGLPVIAVGTKEDSAEEMKLLDAGADDYVHLPLEPEVLTARVKAVLRRVRAAHA